MSAPSLYRRHRPRTFDDVVGQEHVVRTLRNALEQDKVHHAYLFVGSRGTGKTSMAKILAACLNCQGDPDLPAAERVSGPTVAPCGRCEPCRSIADATSIDVVEMDAASNNSVDDIRDLRDSVAFSPVGGRHKVYILDEAHMLSSAAWNAFLKTLEEPPPRTIFVLATTEANKVLPTVVDRCHRFDFHRPTPEQLARVLGRVADKEHFTVAPEAIALVARHATGSFRDALGTLEQLVTYAGSDITTDDVLSVLGVADAELLFRAFDAVAAGDAAVAVGVAGDLSAQGRDLVEVTRDIESHARALLLVRMIGVLPDELKLSPDRDARTVEQAQRLPGATVIRVLDLVAAALSAVRDGADPRTQLELLLIRAALPQIDPQAKAMAARIVRLEEAAAGNGASADVAAPLRPAAPDPAASVASSGNSHPQSQVDVAPVPAVNRTDRGETPEIPADRPHAADQRVAVPAPSHQQAAVPAPSTISDARPAATAPPTTVVTPPGPGASPQAVPSAVPTPAWGTPGAPDPASPQVAEAPSAAFVSSSAQNTSAAAPVPTGDAPTPSAPPAMSAAPLAAPAAAPAPDAPFTAPAPTAPAPSAMTATPAAPQTPHASPAPPPGISDGDVNELLPTIADQMPGNAVKAALGQATVVQVSGRALVLGVPAGKGSAARLLNREDARAAIADALFEILGVRYDVQAEERATLQTPEEPLLPEAEVIRRVVAEFEAEEVAEDSSETAPNPSTGDA